MKKYAIMILFLICLSINTYQAISKNNCTNEIKPTSLNSKNLLNYIEENNLIESIHQVCSSEICVTINPSNMKRDIQKFMEKHINYIKSKSEEAAIDAQLKGFKIDSIRFYSCVSSLSP